MDWGTLITQATALVGGVATIIAIFNGVYDLREKRRKAAEAKHALTTKEAHPPSAPPIATATLPPEPPTAVSPARPLTNLPTQRTRLIGRGRELTDIKALLADTRLLTLVGPGGTGKTRLALHIAQSIYDLEDKRHTIHVSHSQPELVDRKFPDGIWLVEFAALVDPALVTQTVATVFGVTQFGSATLDDLLINYLRAKRVLVILDNCEHLIDACARLADTLLNACPLLHLVATSREALGIPGETLYRVPPLSLPPAEHATLDILRQSEAVQLFVDRATAIQPTFALSEHNAPAVAQICVRLDGIPLAVELAAARVRLLTPAQIAARLDDRFGLLTGGSRAALPRQQTLRALIDWSYDLLPAPEQTLLQALSVFAGDWTLEAAEAVAGYRSDTLDGLAQLVDKSLVVVDQEATETTRYGLLETIRQYGQDRLAEAGEVETVRTRHLHYFRQLVEQGAPHVIDAGDATWVEQCEREYDNYRSALDWGLAHDAEAALGLASALGPFWRARVYGQEGQHWLQGTLARVAALPTTEPDVVRRRQAARAKGCLAVSNLSFGRSEDGLAFEAAQEAVRLYEQLGDTNGLCFALGALGFNATFQGDLMLAEHTLRRAMTLAQTTDNSHGLAFALGSFGTLILLPRGDLVEGRVLLEESVRLARKVGSPYIAALANMGLADIVASGGAWDAARTYDLAAMTDLRELRQQNLLNIVYSHLAHIERRAGNLAEARRLYAQTIVYWQDLGHRPALAHELECFALLAQAEGQPTRAARLFGAAEAQRDLLHVPMTDAERIEYKQAVIQLREQLGPDAYAAVWAAGRALTVDQAIAYALE